MANSEDLAQLKIERPKPGTAVRSRRHPGRWIAGAAVIVILALLTLWKLVIDPVVAVTSVTVSRLYPSQTFTVLNGSGYVVAQRKASVASKGSGRLLWLGVEEGSTVKKGQVIARLESDELRAVVDQARADREASLSNRNAARANRDNAAATRNAVRATVEEARAELDDASVAFERQRQLLAAGVTTRADYDSAEARSRKARAALAGAEQSLRAADHAAAAAGSSLAAAEHSADAAAASERGAAVNVAYTEIKAPFDGVVLTKNADVGDMVTPLGSAANAQAAVVTMADLSSLQVEADVSEANLQKVHVGQPCEVQLDALPEARFPGVVHMIVPTADRAKGTVMAKVRLLKPDPRILPEMSAKVAFLEHPVAPGDAAPRTAVPPSAVASRSGGSVVFRIENGRAKAVPVVLGEPLGGLVEVRSGVKGGEKIVLKPPARLRSGARVKTAED